MQFAYHFNIVCGSEISNIARLTVLKIFLFKLNPFQELNSVLEESSSVWTEGDFHTLHGQIVSEQCRHCGSGAQGYFSFNVLRSCY